MTELSLDELWDEIRRTVVEQSGVMYPAAPVYTVDQECVIEWPDDDWRTFLEVAVRAGRNLIYGLAERLVAENLPTAGESDEGDLLRAKLAPFVGNVSRVDLAFAQAGFMHVWSSETSWLAELDEHGGDLGGRRPGPGRLVHSLKRVDALAADPALTSYGVTGTNEGANSASPWHDERQEAEIRLTQAKGIWNRQRRRGSRRCLSIPTILEADRRTSDGRWRAKSFRSCRNGMSLHTPLCGRRRATHAGGRRWCRRTTSRPELCTTSRPEASACRALFVREC